MNNRTISHPHPVWGDRADADVAVTVEGDDQTIELLPVQTLSAKRHVVCALPFFAYGISLGDEIASDEGRLVSVVAHSDYFTYRISLDEKDGDEGDAERPPSEELKGRASALVSELEQLGYLVEWWDVSWGAVAAKSHDNAERLVSLLTERESAGLLTWEASE